MEKEKALQHSNNIPAVSNLSWTLLETPNSNPPFIGSYDNPAQFIDQINGHYNAKGYKLIADLIEQKE